MSDNINYEGLIDGYTFLMKDDVIEVWSGMDDEYPISFIYTRPGSIKNKKDFDYEIMTWYAHR